MSRPATAVAESRRVITTRMLEERCWRSEGVWRFGRRLWKSGVCNLDYRLQARRGGTNGERGRENAHAQKTKKRKQQQQPTGVEDECSAVWAGENLRSLPLCVNRSTSQHPVSSSPPIRPSNSTRSTSSSFVSPSTASLFAGAELTDLPNYPTTEQLLYICCRMCGL